MGFDWEDILDAEGADLADAYDDLVAGAEAYDDLVARAEAYDDHISRVAETTHYVNSADYCVGTWQGTNIRFKKTFSNHTFTEEECAKLLADEVIEFPATTKDGREYTAKGKLENLEYNGHKYVGFKPEWH